MEGEKPGFSFRGPVGRAEIFRTSATGRSSEGPKPSSGSMRPNESFSAPEKGWNAVKNLHGALDEAFLPGMWGQIYVFLVRIMIWSG